MMTDDDPSRSKRNGKGPDTCYIADYTRLKTSSALQYQLIVIGMSW